MFEKLSSLILAVCDAQQPINTSERKPVLVVNTDTIERGGYAAFLHHLEDRGQQDLACMYTVRRIRSTDTCQMWIHGWDTILEESEGGELPDEGIIQLPGDLKDVRGDFSDFLGKLRHLRLKLHESDFVIGDFETDPFGAKALIDTYGTLPLLLAWFPHVASAIRRRHRISRPRSEFLAMSSKFIRTMIAKRKFAYEQTLALLIYTLEFPNLGLTPGKTWRIDKVDMGLIADHGDNRGFREAVDQIERTERMLRALWRDMNGNGDAFSVTEFETFDRRSTAVRENAMITLENYLTPVGKGRSVTTASGRI